MLVLSAWLLTGVFVAIQACTSENITDVVVTSVTVIPSSSTITVGETAQFEARVVDETGVELQGPGVVWSVREGTGIVEVDEDGIVNALAEGTATISAQFRDASGSGSLTVLPAPRIGVRPSSVTLYGGAGGPAPEPVVLEVANGGEGPLGSLGSDVSYADDPDGWLTAVLADDATPTEMELFAESTDLAAGVYAASVTLTSPDAPDAPSSVPVSLSLTSFTLNESDAGPTVSEDGGTDEIEVVLDLLPASNVVLEVASADTGEVTVSPASLTFTPETWDTPQTVTLTGVDDSTIDGDQETAVTVSVDADQSDRAYRPAIDRSVAVTTLDVDAAGFRVSETNGETVVTEDGGRDSLTVVLSTRPATDVVLVVTASDPGEATAAPESLRFTASNWNEPQVIIVAGVDDDLVDGPQTSTITIGVDVEQSDPDYHGLPDQSVSVATLDNDGVGLVVLETQGNTIVTETGGSDTVTVALAAQPETNVVVLVTSADEGEVTVNRARLTFTASNWSSAQIVTLTGVDDDVADGDVETTVTFEVDDDASDPAFAGLSESVEVTTLDDDEPGLILAGHESLVVTEAGGTDAFSVRLRTAPTSNVALSVLSEDVGRVTASPTSLTFTPTNWSSPQTVTLTGVEDDIVDSVVTQVLIVVRPESSDPAYAQVPALAVNVTTVESYTLSVTKSGTGTVTSSPTGISIAEGETSGSASFEDGTAVTLTATPSAGWRIESWGGACSGVETTCAVTMTSDLSASVTFTEIPPESYTLSVTKSGAGTVTSSPGGISIVGGG